MKSVLFTALRALLGSVFAASGLIKLLQPSEQFLAVILGFEIVGGFPARLLAVALPWAEFTLGVFLILGLWSSIATLGLWALNSAFILALASVLIRRLPLENCGCFGEKFSLPVWATVLLDLGIWGAYLLYWKYGRKHRSISLDKFF